MKRIKFSIQKKLTLCSPLGPEMHAFLWVNHQSMAISIFSSRTVKQNLKDAMTQNSWKLNFYCKMCSSIKNRFCCLPDDYHIIFISIPLIHTRSTYNLLDIEPVVIYRSSNVNHNKSLNKQNNTTFLIIDAHVLTKQ
jgi:hypothetical protein